MHDVVETVVRANLTVIVKSLAVIWMEMLLMLWIVVDWTVVNMFLKAVAVGIALRMGTILFLPLSHLCSLVLFPLFTFTLLVLDMFFAPIC